MAAPTVLVVGAGPAGLRAAERLVAAGLRPILVDENRASGGQIYRRQPAGFTRPPEALYGFEADKARAIHGVLAALGDRVDYRPDTLVWHLFEGEAHLIQGTTASSLKFDALILATGATDRVIPLPGWTLPGVFTLGAAQIALKAQACAIGERTIFMGTGPLLPLVTYQYAKAGARVEAVLDTSRLGDAIAATPALASRPAMLGKGFYYLAWLKRAGIRFERGVTPIAVEGQGSVSGLRWRDAGGREHRTDCDAVGIGYGLRSETQLADLARADFAFDRIARAWLPVTDADGRTTSKGVYLAGDGARITGADAAEIAGRLAACAALRDLDLPVDAAEIERHRAALAPMARFREGLDRAFPFPSHLATGLADETIVCRCECITAGDIRSTAHDKGAPELNRAKALGRVGMGRCQGRMCGPAAAEVLADALALPVDQVGRLRGQGPVKPLPLATEFTP